MEELKPCPFCGGEVAILSDENELREFKDKKLSPFYAVFCNAATNLDNFSAGGCGASGGFYPTKEQAIAAWNSRADNWISVDERLPENNTEVLISIDYGNGKQSVLMGYMRSQDVSWRGVVGQKLIGVTHWQPLPKPPKAKGE